MKFRVTIVSKAKKQLLDSALWWSEHRSPEQASRWLDGFEERLRSLSSDPHKQPRTRESASFTSDLREIHYGLGRKPTHRAIFEIIGDEVVVYTVRHLAQRDITPDDLQS